MAEKNDPSIYDDRSTIGSSDELDEYGVWVKSEPQDLSSSLPDIEELPNIDDSFTDDLDLPDFSDAGEAEAPDTGPADVLEFEEVPENSDLPKGLRPTAIDKDGFTEVSMADFLDSASDLEVPESIDFGDLDSTVPDIENKPAEVETKPVEVETKPAEPAASLSPAAENLSTQLLMKIADELSSIKKELSGLKHELALVRGGGEGAESKGGGFFDEEDDEKIALTGDELDNILNTANFTEESGSGEALGEEFALDMDLEAEPAESDTPLSDKEDIISEEPVQESSEINFNDTDLTELDGALKVEDEVKNAGEDFDISLDLTEDLSDFDENFDDLNVLRETGAVPITPAPEDTSYLEEDPLASISEEDDHIDLSGAVIDEPDLSAHITENPISEPSISAIDDTGTTIDDTDNAIDNISIDLDMEEQGGIPEEASGPGDFIFETEETMEIPVTEEPLVAEEPLVTEESLIDDHIKDEGAFDFPLSEEEPASIIAPPEEAAPPQALPPPGEEAFDFPVSEEEPAAEDRTGFTEGGIPSNLKQELKTVLSYMDQLLESLPDDKIEEFAKSEYFDTYKKLFEELGLV
jgi:hypothetical protein